MIELLEIELLIIYCTQAKKQKKQKKTKKNKHWCLIELLVKHSNTWKNLIVCERMSNVESNYKY